MMFKWTEGIVLQESCILFALLGLMSFSTNWIPNFGKSKLPHMMRTVKVKKLSYALKAAVLFLVKTEVTLLLPQKKKKEKKVSGSCGGLSSKHHFLDYFVHVVVIVNTLANSLVKKSSSYFHKENFIFFNYLESLLRFSGFNDSRM